LVRRTLAAGAPRRIILVKSIWLLWLTAAWLSAQPPRIGGIEFYGLHRLSAQHLQNALHLHAGGPLPASKGDLEERLEKITGVVRAQVEAVCCDGGKTVLFIGIEEKGAPHVAFHTPPAGDAALPQEIADSYEKYLEAVRDAARHGSTAEDLTQGHSLMADMNAREMQERFVEFAQNNVPLLRKVLRESSDDEQRAMAATIIGYAPKKAEVINDLEYAMQDSNESVRANALRALNAIAVLARLQPNLAIRVSPTWFVELLNSIDLSDRTRATTALVSLTDQNAAEALSQIRSRALDSVIEMARWNDLPRALPAFILTGRIAGLDEEKIQAAWTSGDRRAVIDEALHPGRKKKPA